MTLRVGLVGCGWVASKHVEDGFAHVEDVNVVAVSDSNINRGEQFARKYGIPKVFTSHLDLLESAEVDLIDICTPPSTHLAIACDAAKSRCDILLEKPMARTSAECDRIIADCKKNDVMFCTCHTKRFAPSVREAKSLVDEKDILLVRSVHNTEPGQSWVTRPEEGGMLWEEGTHEAYLQQYLLGDIKEIYAVGSKSSHPVYDDIFAILRSTNGSYGVIELSWTSPRKRFEDTLEIYDLNRELSRINLDWQRELVEETTQEFDIYKHTLFSSTIELARKAIRRNRTKSQPQTPSKSYFYYLIPAYINSIRDKISPPVKPSEGRDAIKLLECIEESIEKGKNVRFQ